VPRFAGKFTGMTPPPTEQATLPADDDPAVAPAAPAGPFVGPLRRRPRRPLPLKSYLWIAGAALVVAAALHWLGPVLTPFLFGAILAYVGNPLVNRCERSGIPRSIGTLLAVLMMALAAAAVVLVVVPLVQAEIGMLLRRLPQLADLYAVRVAPWLEDTFGVTLTLDRASLKEMLADNVEQVRTLGLQLLAGVRSGGRLLLAIIVNAALVPVVMFYLLRDGRHIIERIDDLVPRGWVAIVRGTAREIDHVLAEFLRGQALVMVSLALYYTLALWAVGLQFAVPIGLLTGLLVFIPYVGFGLGFTLGILAALLQWHGSSAFLLVVAVYLAGQLLENYVLVPYLVGDRIGLHPLAVIFALLAFGQLFGFAGVLLALPASAALLVGLRRLRAAYLASPVYREP